VLCRVDPQADISLGTTAPSQLSLMSRNQFASLMLKVSGLIGRRDFAAAIGALESYQISNPTDTACLNLLAQCHRWSGADDKAIEVAEKVLEVDPHYFPALKLLSEILAQGSDHERAAAYMRRGVESYPQEMSPLPYFLMQLARVTMRLAAATKNVGAGVRALGVDQCRKPRVVPMGEGILGVDRRQDGQQDSACTALSDGLRP
jgi:tetratricopeptide (TPR) repeat protein